MKHKGNLNVFYDYRDDLWCREAGMTYLLETSPPSLSPPRAVLDDEEIIHEIINENLRTIVTGNGDILVFDLEKKRDASKM